MSVITVRLPEKLLDELDRSIRKLAELNMTRKIRHVK